jgi:hypothetical protein
MSRAQVDFMNPDNSDEVDDFSDIVKDYIKQRKTLKKNLKEHAMSRFDKLKALLVQLIAMLQKTIAFLQQVVREIE